MAKNDVLTGGFMSPPIPVAAVEDDGTRHYHGPGEIPLNPKIRKTVDWLRSLRFRTVDSGDGETHACDCDREYPYVSMIVAPTRLIGEAKRLTKVLELRGVQVHPLGEGKPCIQATFDPASNEGVIDLMYVSDDSFEGT